jgi:4-hydroxybenzoate polyprenyltransferase
MPNTTDIIQLLRPHQWIKNSFVFVGVIFASQWHYTAIRDVLFLFVSFCLIASAVYVVNDICDIEADRQHPKKRYRPLARGAIDIPIGWGLAVVLAIAAHALALLVSWWSLAFVLLYALLNLGYSWRWKHMAIVDVFIIATGFVLRMLVGTTGMDIPPSSWLLLCGFMLALFLGFAKRCAELQGIDQTEESGAALTRRVLDDYSARMIDQFIAVTAACAVLSYGLYAVSDETIRVHGTDALIYTVPFVVYGIFRYLFLLYAKEGGNDTARDFYTDFHLLVTVTAWLLTSLFVLTFR